MVHSLRNYFKSPYCPPFYVLLLYSSGTSGSWLDHIRYHAANPASAANHVAHRTCPVGCLRTAIMS